MRFVKFVFIFILIIIILCSAGAIYAYLKIPNIESPVSVLILGRGGEGHAAPNLTDTIMVAFLNPDLRKINILSLPRDIWIPEIRAKINSAYHYGGFLMAGDSVKSITNVSIDHTIIVDFSLFKDLIDNMGGIDVLVENSFEDQKYPIDGLQNDLCNGDKLFKCRYETLVFTQGEQKMNGEMALKFVRSRNSIGDEGTDLARGKRQQKVITAIKEKLFSKEVLLDPNVINNLYNITKSHLETDIDMVEFLAIGRLVIKSSNDIFFISIPEDMIRVSQNNKKQDYQYVFLPVSDTWEDFSTNLSTQIY